MDIYSRLFTYRDTPSVFPAENFLTEALADLFNRLPLLIRTEFLARMLPASCSSRLRNKCKDGKQIKAETQVSIVAAGSVKRPDMIVYLDSEPLALFEVKVHAALQMHRLGAPEIERPLQADTSEFVFQSQLKTYSEWISSQCSGDWPGAVVFLTHGTRAPNDFDNDGREGNSVIGVTRTWKDIGSWFANNLDMNQSETTHCALASDFVDFLERQGLMTDFMNSRDLAATALFIPTYRALNHTFRTVISEVTLKYPKSKGGNVHLEFWPDGNAYCGWYYLNKQLNPASSKFWIGIGICFPEQGKGALASDDPVRVPMHEPFFFVVIADDWENTKPSELFSNIPKGWVEINKDYYAVVTRAVSLFEADPDARAQSLIAWAKEEVGQVVASIPNFEAVTAENIPEEAEG